MPRKSVADILSERHGGKWIYDYIGTWNCDDEVRFVTRQKNCHCWMFGEDEGCRCPQKYFMLDENGTYEIDVSDPRRYRLNGKKTRLWQ